MENGFLESKRKNFSCNKLAERKLARKTFLKVVVAVVDFVLAFGVMVFAMRDRHFFFEVAEPIQ